jgi:hypothetical protein
MKKLLFINILLIFCFKLYSNSIDFKGYPTKIQLNSDDLNCSKLKIKFKDLAGFRAWYYLQHSVNYKGNFKPFITHAIFYEDLEIKL